MNFKKLIKIKNIKCQNCKEFYAQYMEIEANIRLWQKDDVQYRLICKGCKESEANANI